MLSILLLRGDDWDFFVHMKNFDICEVAIANTINIKVWGRIESMSMDTLFKANDSIRIGSFYDHEIVRWLPLAPKTKNHCWIQKKTIFNSYTALRKKLSAQGVYISDKAKKLDIKTVLIIRFEVVELWVNRVSRIGLWGIEIVRCRIFR